MKPPQATGELRLRHAETNTSHAALSSQLQTCFFSIFLSHQTPRAPASLPTSENVLGPVLIRKKCFAAVKRAESHPAATGNLADNGRQDASNWIKLGMGHPGIAAMAAMDIMILSKKMGCPWSLLNFAGMMFKQLSISWNSKAFDPKGPWKSFRKSHCYQGFVWNPARFDGMHDLVQMVNENYRKNHKITGNMGFLAPFLVTITIFLWFS